MKAELGQFLHRVLDIHSSHNTKNVKWIFKLCFRYRNTWQFRDLILLLTIKSTSHCSILYCVYICSSPLCRVLFFWKYEAKFVLSCCICSVLIGCVSDPPTHLSSSCKMLFVVKSHCSIKYLLLFLKDLYSHDMIKNGEFSTLCGIVEFIKMNICIW